MFGDTLPNPFDFKRDEVVDLFSCLNFVNFDERFGGNDPRAVSTRFLSSARTPND